MLWVLLFGGFITHLPCHVLTLQSDVHVSEAVLKYKNGADIKEVIQLALFPMFTFYSLLWPFTSTVGGGGQ